MLKFKVQKATSSPLGRIATHSCLYKYKDQTRLPQFFMPCCKKSKASLAKIWLLLGQGLKLIKSLKLAKLPKSVQNDSLLGSYVRDNVIDGNHDDTDDDGANVDADSTWY